MVARASYGIYVRVTPCAALHGMHVWAHRPCRALLTFPFSYLMSPLTLLNCEGHCVGVSRLESDLIKMGCL